MTVFVGQLFKTPRVGRWRWDSACHMFADSERELVDFGIGMGLFVKYLQNPGTPRVHFDLTPKRRATAVKLGAVELDRAGEVAFRDMLRGVWRPTR